MNVEPQSSPANDNISNAALASRSIFGGILMGLANLVPGISGGTMLLAAGIYPKFIAAISEITRFRFRLKSLVVLACVVGAAGLAILFLAGLLKDLVVDYRWVMYSLFIGLTLGGVPIVWKLAKPNDKTLCISTVIGFLIMVGLAILQASGLVGDSNQSFFMMVVAGLAGASAMILPGLSGGYLFLLLGQYVPILDGIDQFKEALKAKDFAAMMDPAMTVVLPVAIGIVAGVVIVGNLLQWLLQNQRKATLGLLLGLLLGSVVGLWPFQQAVKPEIGQMIKGQEVTAETIDEIESDDWPNEYFTPSVGHMFGSLALIGVGFAITLGVSAIGGGSDSKSESHNEEPPSTS